MGEVILAALAPIFFILLLGYAAGRLSIIDNQNVSGLNSLVMNFALPASLFAATASAPRAELLAELPLFSVLGAGMLLVFFGWYFVARLLATVTKSEASLEALTTSFPNLAGVGLPIANAVLGPSGTVQVAVALAAGSILVTPVSLTVIEMEAARASGDRLGAIKVGTSILQALSKPVVLASALGILGSLCGFGLNPILMGSLRLVGDIAPGGALFLTGLILSAHPIRLNSTIIAAVGVADIVRPLLVGGLAFGFELSSEEISAAILLATVPSGFFGILFAVNYELDAATTSSMVAASTLFSIATMAVAIALLYP